MFYLKILAQVGVGVSGFIALLLDYKWHDKRKKIFKTLRNALIVISIFPLAAGIIITIIDENDKNAEIKTLQAKLDSVQNNLAQIKQNGDILNERIAPFLRIATNKYPNLSSDAALDSLKRDIHILERKATSLENSELARRTREIDFSNLKKTPPSISALLKMDDKRNIYIGMQFLNKVPIKFIYSLTHSKGGKILNKSNNGILQTELFPSPDGKMFYYKDAFNFPEHIPKQELSQIRLDIFYESIFFLESGNSNLKKQFTKEYTIDPIKNTLTEIQ